LINQSVEGTRTLEKGGLTAWRSNDRITWVHNKLGPVIESDVNNGTIKISLPEAEWKKTPDINRNLLYPGLYPLLAKHGYLPMHASAVELEGRGVIFAGPSGSGKTTAALRLVTRGAAFVADDIVLVSRDKNGDLIARTIGDSPRAKRDTFKQHGMEEEGLVEKQGKYELNRKELIESDSVKIDKLIWLGSEKTSKTGLLLNLLSVTYYLGEQEKTTSLIKDMVESLDIVCVSYPDMSFLMALRA
jgi:DNA polymerase III delta prime subunit